MWRGDFKSLSGATAGKFDADTEPEAIVADRVNEGSSPTPGKLTWTEAGESEVSPPVEPCVVGDVKAAPDAAASPSDGAKGNEGGDNLPKPVCSVSVRSEILELFPALVVEYADTDVAVDTERADRREYTELPDIEFAIPGALECLPYLPSFDPPSSLSVKIIAVFTLANERASDFSECVGDGDRFPLEPGLSAIRLSHRPSFSLPSSLSLPTDGLRSTTAIDTLSAPLAILVRFALTAFLSFPWKRTSFTEKRPTISSQYPR